MTLQERLAAHEAAKCPRCGGTGLYENARCFDCLGDGWEGDPRPIHHAEHAALLRFAVAVEKASTMRDETANLIGIGCVMDAVDDLERDLAALEGGAE